MITNKLNLPQPFVDAATSDHKYTDKRYSVSEVLGGTCEAILKRRHQGEADEDVADRVWAIFGTAVHKVLQEGEATSSQLQEEWLSVPVPEEGYRLSGIFDLYDEDMETVTDYKTASVWKVKFGEFEDWRKQTLLYCYMLRTQGFKATRGQIVALLRDHSQREAKLKAADGYPPHPVFTIGWEFTKEDFEEAERMLADWYAKVSREEQLPDAELEPCSPEQRWHKPDKWAVMKDGRKRAVRVFEDEEQAVALLNELKEKDQGHHIEHRPGEDTKCDGYCPVAEFCHFYQGEE